MENVLINVQEIKIDIMKILTTMNLNVQKNVKVPIIIY